MQHPLYTSYIALFAGHCLRSDCPALPTCLGMPRPGEAAHISCQGGGDSCPCLSRVRPCCSLGSPAAAAFLLATCLWYYARRTALEEQLLDAAFGEEYLRYRTRTGRFLPHLRRPAP